MVNEYRYTQLVNKVLAFGIDRDQERTGTGTISLFAQQLEIDVSNGTLPIMTHRKMFPKGIIGEVISFCKGYDNVADFQSAGCNYWNAWAKEDGDLGPIYGCQWRNFNNQSIDQLRNVIEEAKTNPQSRRLYVTAWNPAQEDEMSLLPCFHGFQLYIGADGELNMLCNMRSSDVIIGLPSDIIFHVCLMRLIANELNRPLGKLVMSLGDVHIYKNHIEFAKTIKSLPTYMEPQFLVNGYATVDNCSQQSFKILNYQHGERQKLEVSV